MRDEPWPGEEVDASGGGGRARDGLDLGEDEELEVVDRRGVRPTATASASESKVGLARGKGGLFARRTYGLRSTPSMTTVRFTPPV